MDDRDNLLQYLRQFALPPSPPRQDEFKTHAEANQPTYLPPGRSRRPALVPPIPGLALASVRRTKAPPYPSRGILFIYKCVLFGSAQANEYSMTKPTPTLVDNEDDHYAPVQALPLGGRRRRCPPSEHGRVRPGTKDCRSRSRSASSGGPTKYTQCWFLLLHRPVARDDAAIKATPSARCYGRVSP